MPTLASLTSQLRKIEAQLVPAQELWCLSVHYGCPYDTEADIEARSPALPHGGMIISIVHYHCPDGPHSHAHERPWPAGGNSLASPLPRWEIMLPGAFPPSPLPRTLQ